MLRKRSSVATSENGIVEGIARIDSRTKRLIGRLQPGEIAVINHDDLDRVAAESLVERRVKAVVNAAPSSTGRYPNLGPLVLAGAGIPLVDDVDTEAFNAIKEGDWLKIEDGRIVRGDEVIGKGEVVTLDVAQQRLDESKREIAGALEQFAENTLQHMASEREVLLEAIRLPSLRTNIIHRHVLVVARGYGYKEDLRSLVSSGYIRDFRPVLIGVDGGADALLERSLRPNVIIGDMDSVSTQALTLGAELVLHAYPDGGAPGQERLDALGLKYVTFEAPGTSEDIALLLAYEKGAELIVVVGARAGMIEFMDKGRKGMASTFLVRLRVGPKLVDAKGVSELHRPGPTRLQLFGLVASAFVTMMIIIFFSKAMQLFFSGIAAKFGEFWFWVQRLVS
jgi:uncharacterized membrane-anchored protein